MRGDWYVYSDGECMYIHGNEGGSCRMPMETFDELVALRWARMDADEQAEAVRRAHRNHGGNFGADGVARLLGEPTLMEQVQAWAGQKGDG